MQSALHITTKVLPGGKIEITDPELRVGEPVDVFLVLPEASSRPRRSALEIIEALNGRRVFQTPQEVNRYLQEERDSWDR
jgi:hypothetical protein